MGQSGQGKEEEKLLLLVSSAEAFCEAFLSLGDPTCRTGAEFSLSRAVSHLSRSAALLEWLSWKNNT